MSLFKKPYQAKYQKKSKLAMGSLLYFLAVVAAIGLSVAVSIPMLSTVLSGFAGGTSSGNTSAKELEIMNRYDMYMTNSVGDALDGIVAIERIYWLSDEDLIAPEPRKDCAGQTTDPSSLEWLLQEAEEKLGVTDTLFSTDVDILDGSAVHYYLDDTIMVITWKELVDTCAYTFSEVKIKHPSQFRRFLADGAYGSAKQYLTTEMAATVNAVTASSGDFYKFRSNGVMVYNGDVYRNDGSVDTCYITEDGEMIFSKQGQITNKAAAEKFVEDNKVRFSLAFGPILVEDGKVPEDVGRTYPIGEGHHRYSRAGLGQLGELHYLMVTANLTTGYDAGTPTITMFANRMQSFGCQKAYSLDGGQTAVIVTNDQLINRPDYGYQRQISDIIYFATALPEED